MAFKRELLKIQPSKNNRPMTSKEVMTDRRNGGKRAEHGLYGVLFRANQTRQPEVVFTKIRVSFGGEQC
jgi:hypothetical protein